MQEYKHSASQLQLGDRVLATIRHDTDGSMNIHNALVIVVANNERDQEIKGALGQTVFQIPYNELKEITKKCKCKNITFFGSEEVYRQQIILTVPCNINPYDCDGNRKDEICIDPCLVDEIKHLWSLGITTTGCCCGHNIGQGYIGVIDEDIPKMKELGYTVLFNPSRPDDEDSFLPKSIINEAKYAIH